MRGNAWSTNTRLPYGRFGFDGDIADGYSVVTFAVSVLASIIGD